MKNLPVTFFKSLKTNNTSSEGRQIDDTVAEKISEILHKLQLVPLLSPHDFIKRARGYQHRYYSICHYAKKTSDKKYFFYALLMHNQTRLSTFFKEIRFAEHINKYPTGLNQYFPKYVRFSEKNKLPWIVKEFIPFNTMEDMKKIESLSKPLSTESIRSVAKAIYKVNVKFLQNRPALRVQKYNVDKVYNEIFEELIPFYTKNSFFDTAEVEKIKKICSNAYPLLKNESIYFAHGDLHLGNIIFFNNDQVKIIDWESYHMNNFCYDIAYFFCRLFREPLFRRKLVHDFASFLPDEKKSLFAPLMQFNIIYDILKYKSMIFAREEFTDQEKIQRKTWTKRVFFNSLLGFKNIMHS